MLRKSDAAKLRVTLAGFAVLFILLDQSDGDDFTNIRTGNFPLFGNGSERLFTKSK